MADSAVATPPAAAPVTPSPAPVVTAQPVSKPAADMNDAFAQLDKMGVTQDEPDAVETKEVPEKVEVTPPAKSEVTEKTTTTTKETPPELSPEKMAPKQLREAYGKAKGLATQLEAKVKELETKLSDKPAEDVETPKLRDTLKQREERLAKIEEELQFTKYEASDDYKERYQQPFYDSYAAGRARAATLLVNNEDGTVRKGTAEDFDALARIVDDNAASDFAVERFGNKAPLALFDRAKVQETNSARVKALDEYRTKGVERQKQVSEQSAAQQKQVMETFEGGIKEGVEKYPQWFKPVDGDDKGNELLEKGRELAEIAFRGMVKDPETGQMKRVSPQQQAKLHAAMFNKAAGFDRLVFQTNGLKKQVASLQKELQQYKSSEPGAGDTTGAKKVAASSMSEVDKALSALPRH